MTDQMFSSDIFSDSNFSIKQEPGDSQMITSASVPIPQRRLQDPFDQFSNELYSPGLSQDALASSLDNTMWGVPSDVTSLKMDDEDIFQVDKADLIGLPDPTLAELNAKLDDDTLLGDLTFDDLMLPVMPVTTPITVSVPETNSSLSQIQQLSVSQNPCSASSLPSSLGLFLNNPISVSSSPLDVYFLQSGNTQIQAALSPSSHSSNSSLPQPSPGVSPLQMKHSTLHELLMKKEPYSPPLGRSMPGPTSPLRSAVSPTSHRTHHTRLTRHLPSGGSSRLSSSAPTHLGHDQIWQRREPRKHLLSTGSLAEAGSTSSLSTGGVLSPESHNLSPDEDDDSDEDSDRFEYDDFSSDESGSDGEGTEKDKTSRRISSKKEKYFWQYNIQAKGPKGQRLVLSTKHEDPHVLNEVTDPVFSPSCSVRGIKHSGKARKGDGNDLTPNPKKLHSIGKELDKLGRVINDMTPVSELPFNVRPKSRKEKNKLASRACRLKKKAQHEAHKIKLHGLELEHKKLISGIQQMKQLITAKLQAETPEDQDELNKHIDKVVKNATKIKIAGHTTEYVNKVLEKVKNGESNVLQEDP